MPDSPESSPATEGDAAQAFDELRLEVLYVRRAVEELPNALHEARSPDYTVSLGEIAKGLRQAAARLEVIESHPALRLTPAMHQQAIADGARVVMREPLERLHEVQRASEQLNEDLASIVGSARRQDQQFKWLLAIAAAGLIIGLFLAPFFAHLLPFGLDGRIAAAIMGADRWHAGAALMEAENPQGWRVMQSATALWQANEASVEDCRESAARLRKGQHCTIVVAAP